MNYSLTDYIEFLYMIGWRISVLLIALYVIVGLTRTRVSHKSVNGD